MFWWFCADFSNISGIFGVRKNNEAENGDKRRQSGTKWHEERRQAEMEAQFGSIFTYNHNNCEENQQNFGSSFWGTSFSHQMPNSSFTDENFLHKKWTFSDRLLHTFCTVFSSTFLLLTFPFSLPFSLKFIGPSERLVIMRLGRTKSVHGPGGTVLILPWVDKATAVDLRMSPIELPAIRSLTADQGMVELTVTVFGQITDALKAHCSIQNVTETLSSLAYATLCRRLCKLLISDLTNSNTMERVLLAKCQDELNAFVRPRGVSVERLAVTRLTVLKAADSSSTAMSVLRTVANSQFGQQLFSQFLPQQPPQQMNSPITPELIIANSNCESDAHQQQKKSSNSVDAMSTISEETTAIDNKSDFDNALDVELVALLERICAALCPSLVRRIGRLFRVRCLVPTSPSGPSSTCNTTTKTVEFDIDLRSGNGWCGRTWQRMGPPPQCDVLFTLQKCTLLALLDGTVAPLCAYLEGRVQIDGSVQDAALLKHLADAIGETAATEVGHVQERRTAGEKEEEKEKCFGGGGENILQI